MGGERGAQVSQFLGGLDELRGFTEAGDTEGWAHHVLWSGTDGDVEFALGETRYDDSGERIGTFLAVAKLDEDGRMYRYMVARTPALSFPAPTTEAGSSWLTTTCRTDTNSVLFRTSRMVERSAR